ncbi:multiple epidermal growth factor-like domains protein 6 [Haliotis rufescens]|uniref:multiple epidermal growth factor-like domains protein 6 n=1 Tax=Haliotis rufescens TaxID=6454 RepID=UPI00201F3B40|nr:multiple epidermal growth factor-like domains protein 6 [Haliotis rufescens]XP_048256397.1 multiple epidermal growth factor-like domains protein 6 [Haliotis rufescens]
MFCHTLTLFLTIAFTEVAICVSLSSNVLCDKECNACSSHKCSDNCIKCPTGFYGPDCTRSCPPHCAEGCCELLSSGRSVNCTQGCQDGYRGLTCNTRCKRPCLTCDRYTGDCTGPCRNGFYGSGCTRRCSQPCDYCVKVTGECVEQCNDSLCGVNCTVNCPMGCKKCDRYTGECFEPCEDGYYGVNCTMNCPIGCLKCDKHTGGCPQERLAKGYQGNRSSAGSTFTRVHTKRNDVNSIEVSCDTASYPFIIASVVPALVLTVLVALRYSTYRRIHKPSSRTYSEESEHVFTERNGSEVSDVHMDVPYDRAKVDILKENDHFTLEYQFTSCGHSHKASNGQHSYIVDLVAPA